MTLVIVLPTYNERENVRTLIPGIQAQRARTSHDLHILVVDDNSPDGTADVVRELQAHDPSLHLITGRKEGLGRAYVRGMTHAISQLGADGVIQMDADHSHNPEDLPRLIHEMDQGYDFVIGSRYVTGGSIPATWSAMRRANSRYGNIVARWVAGMRSVNDCTAGFRCIRADVLAAVRIEDIRANGYCFMIEILHKALGAGARVKEIPVHFVDRTSGTSKLGLSDIAEFLMAVWKLRLGSAATFAAFCVVGLIGIGVNLSVLAALLRLGVGAYAASPLAVLVSIVTNVGLYNAITALSRGQSFRSVRRFDWVSLLHLPVICGTFVILMLSTDLQPLAAQAIGIVPAVFLSYLLSVYWAGSGRRGR
jgi:dolichol-phosphate mannosyltransferase